MIKEIISREWDFFQKVSNIGGRATCQNDYETFNLQRTSQFKAYYPEVDESYLNDLKECERIGRNPLMEKYAYMMESTDPEFFKTIVDGLPPIDEDKKKLVDMICEIEVEMREEFNNLYPHLAGNARDTHSSDDTDTNTSFETYLRGELYTYSSNTLYEYGKMIVDMLNKGENLVIKIQDYTVKAYGYASLEACEQSLAKEAKNA